MNGSKFMYGDVLNAIISFLIVASVVYFLVVAPMNILITRSKRREEPTDPSSKKCPECLSEIPVEATRCAFCTIKVVEALPIENV